MVPGLPPLLVIPVSPGLSLRGSPCFPGGTVVKNLPASGKDKTDVGLTPGMGRSPGGRHGNPLQYSCLETPMDRGAWWATVQGGYKEEDMNWAAKHMATPGPSPHLLATRAFPHGPLVPKDQLYLGCHNQIPQTDWLRKGRGARDHITNIRWVIEKAREFQKNICFIDCTKAFDCLDHNKMWKILK